MMRVTPASTSRATVYSASGNPPTGTSGFGRPCAASPSRSALPPARRSASISSPGSPSRLRRPADRLVLEARCRDGGRVEEVAPVDDERPRHRVARPRRSGDSRSSGHSVTITAASASRTASSDGVAELDARQVVGLRDRIPAAHLGALGDQARRDDAARRLAHVVGVRLEREAEERDPSCRAACRGAAGASGRHAASAARSPPTPPAGGGTVAGVAGELLERGDVLREARAAEADARRRKCGPRRWSRPTPRATSTTSAPTSSQTFAISLMKLMRVDEERVRGELHELRGGDVGADDSRVDARVERRRRARRPRRRTRRRRPGRGS